MPKFTWDPRKAEGNRHKHRVTFEEAGTVFDDEDALEFAATRHEELRIIRIGKSATKIILLVVYTLRGVVVRLISARPAGRDDRNLYLERKLKKQSDDHADR